jgi:hypothetical protein
MLASPVSTAVAVAGFGVDSPKDSSDEAAEVDEAELEAAEDGAADDNVIELVSIPFIAILHDSVPQLDNRRELVCTQMMFGRFDALLHESGPESAHVFVHVFAHVSKVWPA